MRNKVQEHVRSVECMWCMECTCMHGHSCAGDGEDSKEQGGVGLIGCE